MVMQGNAGTCREAEDAQRHLAVLEYVPVLYPVEPRRE